MNKKIIIELLFISIAMTLITSAISTIIFSHGKNFAEMNPGEWKNLEEMNYKDAMKYIDTHSKKMSGWDILKENYTSIPKFLFFIKHIGWSFMINLVIALVVAFRIIRIKEKETNKLNT